MPIVDKASCSFHLELSRLQLHQTLRDRILVLEKGDSDALTKKKLFRKPVQLLQKIHDWQDIVVCEACWTALGSGKAVPKVLFFEVAFRWFRRSGKEGHVRDIYLGNLVEYSDGPRVSFGFSNYGTGRAFHSAYLVTVRGKTKVIAASDC
jgi:ethanolamine utilization protein EutQ (cupin superfamily)